MRKMSQRNKYRTGQIIVSTSQGEGNFLLLSAAAGTISPCPSVPPSLTTCIQRLFDSRFQRTISNSAAKVQPILLPTKFLAVFFR